MLVIRFSSFGQGIFVLEGGVAGSLYSSLGNEEVTLGKRRLLDYFQAVLFSKASLASEAMATV